MAAVFARFVLWAVVGAAVGWSAAVRIALAPEANLAALAARVTAWRNTFTGIHYTA